MAEWDDFQSGLAARLDAAVEEPRDPASPAYDAVMRHWMAEGLSPEDWAARHARNLASFSGGDYRYADARLDDWVQRLNAMLFTPGAVAVCRRRYLTPDEIEAAAVRDGEF